MFVATVLILLHAPGGMEILVNPQMVTSLHAARDDKPNQYLTDDVACMIALADGKFVSVTEHCDVVQKLIQEGK